MALPAGWTYETPYHVFTDPAFVLRLLLGSDERLDAVCNVDAFIEVPGKGTWAATVVSLDEVRRLMDRWRTTGENASGAYFVGVDDLIIREPGGDAVVAAVRDLVDEGYYDLYFIKSSDDDSPDALETLAELASVELSATRDEHVRRRIYQHALSIPDAHRDLRIAITNEPSRSLAAEVVVAVFDHIPPGDRPAWISALPPRMRPFPTRRSEELAVAEAHLTGPPPDDINVWSDWLLHRIATTTQSQEILAKLATEARTRRARTIATQRLNARNPQPDGSTHQLADAGGRAVGVPMDG